MVRATLGCMRYYGTAVGTVHLTGFVEAGSQGEAEQQFNQLAEGIHRADLPGLRIEWSEEDPDAPSIYVHPE